MKLFFVLLLLPCLYFCNYAGEAKETKPAVEIQRTKLIALEARNYCRNKNLDTSICILIDMSLHSGIKRFMIWDFEGDSLLTSGLVSHGCCDKPWGSDQTKSNPRFSNTDGSHCTALGKYRIGKRGYSNWGIKVNYLMHGLERSNNNALARQIVLHGWNEIPQEEVYPLGSPEGWGCPAIANSLMLQVDELLKARQNSVLMWIYR